MSAFGKNSARTCLKFVGISRKITKNWSNTLVVNLIRADQEFSITMTNKITKNSIATLTKLHKATLSYNIQLLTNQEQKEQQTQATDVTAASTRLSNKHSRKRANMTTKWRCTVWIKTCRTTCSEANDMKHSETADRCPILAVPVRTLWRRSRRM